MTSSTSSKKQKRIIIAVIVIGIFLGGAILLSGRSHNAGDDPGHADHEKTEAGMPAKGPHGGKLITDGDYSLEISIFEQGVEPQFRLYAYLKDKPLDPAQSKVELTLERLGQTPQVFKFIKEVRGLQLNNAIFPFDTSQDIVVLMREQLAGLFQTGPRGGVLPPAGL